MKLAAWWLPLVLGGSLGATYLLPQAGQIADSAVRMELPGSYDGWTFNHLPASQAELKTLPPDTQFAKAVCLRPRPGEIAFDGRLIPDRVDLSVVLSGHDLNSSIHRPERCMPAQGHHITASGNVRLQTDRARWFQAKRLRSVQSIKTESGETFEMKCLTYYFFVGHNQITNDHLARTLIDMKDRLWRGMDQRWAYVSASMWYGKVPWIEKEVTEQEADAKVSKFLTDFASEQIDWDGIN